MTEPDAGMILTADRLTEWCMRGQMVGFWKRDNGQNIANVIGNNPEDGTPIAWDSTVFDLLGSRLDPPDNSRIQPPMPGWYLVQGAVGWTANTGGTSRSTSWLKNGQAVPAGRAVPVNTPSMPNAAQSTLARSIIIDVNGTSDYIELVGIQDSGAGLFTTSSDHLEPYMTLTYVGPL